MTSKETENIDVIATIQETGKSTDDRLDLVIKLITEIKIEHKEVYQQLEKRLDKFEQSMHFINTQFEDHKAITESLIKRNTALEDKNTNLTKLDLTSRRWILSKSYHSKPHAPCVTGE